jgi:hypothetical protein
MPVPRPAEGRVGPLWGEFVASRPEAANRPAPRRKRPAGKTGFQTAPGEKKRRPAGNFLFIKHYLSVRIVSSNSWTNRRGQVNLPGSVTF